MMEAKPVVEREALQRLQEITTEILGELELDPLLKSILAGVVDLLDADHGHLYRYDAETDALRTWIPIRLPAGIAEVVLARGEGAAGSVLGTGKPVAVDDYDSWEGRSRRIPPGESGPVIAVPVQRGSELLGVIVADRSPGGEVFADQDVELLQLFANQAAVAIANAQLYAEAARSAEEMTQLYDTSLDIVQELDLTTVLRAILDRANLLLDAQSANLRLHDPQQNLLVPAVPTEDSDQFGTTSLTPGEGVSGQAFASGEPVVVADYDTWESRSAKFPAGLFARVMAVPVKRGSEVVGALGVERGKDHPRFDDDDVRLLSLFANQAGVAVQNAQLFQKAQEHSKELAHLYDTSLDITSTLDLSTVIESVIRRSADVVEAQVGEVVVFDPERGVTSAFLSIGLDEAGLPLSPHDIGQPPEGLDGLVISTGKPVRVDDYDAWPQRLSVAPVGVVGPIMGVPIVHRSEVLGSLSLVRSSGGPTFTEEDERLLILFANQAAVAIANARTFEEADQRRRELAHLYDTSLDISSDLELPKVLEAVMHRTADLVEAHAGEVVVRDPAQGTVAAHYHLGFQEAAIPLAVQEVGKPPRGLNALVFETGTPVRVDDYATWPKRVASIPRDALGPIIGIPLIHQGEALGALLLGRKPGEQPFTPEDESRLLLFANQAAVAIANAQLYQETTTRAAALASLYDTSLELTGQLELQRLLEAIGVRAETLLEGKFVEIVLYDPEKEELRDVVWVTRGEARVVTDPFITRAGEGIDGRILLSGEPLVIDDYNIWEGRMPYVRTLRAPRVAAVPIKLGNEFLGTLKVRRLLEDPNFSEDELQLLGLFANQAAVAIQNARQVEELQRLHREQIEKERMDRELGMAREIQTSLLPDRSPSIPGWDAAAYWHPALEIAGDFYDFIDLGDSRWALVVGDVADKGVPAALFMSLTRSLFHAYAGMGIGPAEVLRRVNGEMLENSRSGMFVTALYAMLDGRSNTIEILNAGHHPALVHRRRAGRVEAVRMGGIALGIVEEPTFEGKTLRLAKGDRVVLYTDGVTDARNAEDEEFGLKRLRKAFREAPDGSSQRVLDKLHAAVEAFSQGTAQFDDFTYIVLTRRA